MATIRRYGSPPRRPGSWAADRPGDIVGDNPRGARLGMQGPDQGYALKLVHQFADKLHLGDLDRDDVEAGCVAIAMKRSALFGRAPVIHDLTAAFSIFGFLDKSPDAGLVVLRQRVFPEVHSHHHYSERRQIVDMVPDEVLMQSHGQIIDDYEADWERNLR